MEGAPGWGRIRRECRFHSPSHAVSCVVSMAPTGRTVWLADLPRGMLKLGEDAELLTSGLPVASALAGQRSVLSFSPLLTFLVMLPFHCPIPLCDQKNTYHKGVWGPHVSHPWRCTERRQLSFLPTSSLAHSILSPFLSGGKNFGQGRAKSETYHQGFAPLCLEHPPIGTLLITALLN